MAERQVSGTWPPHLRGQNHFLSRKLNVSDPFGSERPEPPLALRNLVT